MKGNFSKTDLLKIFKEYGLISIGGLMYSFAWTSILIPAGVMGGVTVLLRSSMVIS